ncbi:hypothetical protein [Paracoccus zeaxanthinifaciens]|uniref:hypothetical protein n=1 Tax=Paracoccus zeaxanthinifaciens TaxID=187400 RepID=UPI0003B50FF1|nr:hypothetical protein [Paracoccus zeaxanthinifaciens]
MNKIAIFSVVAAGALAACSPKQFETAPVTIDTPQGPVTCQLYTKGLTDWDRSISRPDALSVEAADTLCKNEGIRQKNS